MRQKITIFVRLNFIPLERFKTKKTLREHLLGYRKNNLRIAFVPTMGALHQGHISLVRHAQKEADVVVCSIFVNPTQFNDSDDLKKYPRPIENDIRMLEDAGCEVLFYPEVNEMYQAGEQWHLELGRLDQILEAKHRPGHFQGVTQIVKKLFDLVEPDLACFGQKDFQQFKVVERMVEQLRIPVRLVMTPTVREPDGLAMSSRNVRLSESGRIQALALYRTLQQMAADFAQKSPAEVQEAAIRILENSPGVDVEYVALCDARNLEPLDPTNGNHAAVALIAAWVEGVRLIDNLLLENAGQD